MEHTFQYPFCLAGVNEAELPITILCDACMWNIMEDRRIEAETLKEKPEFAKFLGLMEETAPSRVTMFAILQKN